MKYLNVGCGFHFSSSSEWVNLDFTKSGENVISHNLLEGIPFEKEKFDLVYHSHVLEHFLKEDGESLMKECFRVCKPGGVIRVVIPDLEQIARNYLKHLDHVLENSGDKLAQDNYEWSMIELFDQTVRNYSGGQMAEFLARTEIMNEDFVFSRIGQEGEQIRAHLKANGFKSNSSKIPKLEEQEASLLTRIKRKVARKLIGNFELMTPESKAYEQIGRFRMGGEIHQWMYDQYSTVKLLEKVGFKEAEIRKGNVSYIPNWASFELDVVNGKMRKPDSLIIEAKKL